MKFFNNLAKSLKSGLNKIYDKVKDPTPRLKSEFNWICDKVKDGTVPLAVGAASTASYILTETGTGLMKPVHEWLVDGPVNKIINGQYWLDGGPETGFIDVPNVSPYLAIAGFAYGGAKFAEARGRSNVEAYKKIESNLVDKIISELETNGNKNIESLDAAEIYGNVLEKLRTDVKSFGPIFKKSDQKAFEAFRKDKGSEEQKGSYLNIIKTIKNISDPGKREELANTFVDPSQVERLNSYLKSREEKNTLSNSIKDLKNKNEKLDIELRTSALEIDNLRNDSYKMKYELRKYKALQEEEEIQKNGGVKLSSNPRATIITKTEELPILGEDKLFELFGKQDVKYKKPAITKSAERPLDTRDLLMKRPVSGLGTYEDLYIKYGVTEIMSEDNLFEILGRPK